MITFDTILDIFLYASLAILVITAFVFSLAASLPTGREVTDDKHDESRKNK